jgi:hypothetical protein
VGWSTENEEKEKVFSLLPMNDLKFLVPVLITLGNNDFVQKRGCDRLLYITAGMHESM